MFLPFHYFKNVNELVLRPENPSFPDEIVLDHFNPFTTRPWAIFLLLENDNLGIIN